MNCGKFSFHTGEHPNEVRSRCCKANAVPGRPRVFCASLADVFEDWAGPISSQDGDSYRRCTNCPWSGLCPILLRSNSPSTTKSVVDCPKCGSATKLQTMNDVRHRLFELIDATPNLDWLLLTKRPENIWRMWPLTDGTNEPVGILSRSQRRKNVWLGTSVENQEWAEKRIPELLKCRGLSPVLFLSCEPLVGGVDLSRVRVRDGEWMNCLDGSLWDAHGPWTGCDEGMAIDWVIAGGESGPNARPSHPSWFRSLRDQCLESGVPFHFKQWGEFTGANIRNVDSSREDRFVELDGTDSTKWKICDHGIGTAHMVRIGKSKAGRILDGQTWDQFPVGYVSE